MERIASFEKISKTDFNEPYYDSIKLPLRATEGSAGYDFFMPYDLTINPKESVEIYSNIRCKIDEGYVLMIFPRSSLGRKYKLTLDNTIGVIDGDYYNATNEGHIIVMATNNSDKVLELKAGDRFCQGVFLKFGITKDDSVLAQRTGGFGSTGK